MAKVYSWAVSETQYAYIIHPNDIDKDSPRAYVGTELKGNNLQKVVNWVQSCENSEYESQFEKMLALCESKNINVNFENVASYMNIESSCDNLRGPAGKGIKSLVLEKSDSITNIDTYVIYYTDGTTDRFTIKQGINGRDGRDGKDGARGDVGVSSKLFMIYTSGKDSSGNEFTPAKPEGGSYDFYTNEFTCPNGWYQTDSEAEPPIWMSTRTFASSDLSTDKEWSKPVRITGENGLPGADGTSIEYIFQLRQEYEPKDINELYSPEDENGYVPKEWTGSPQGVTEDDTREWCSIRKKNPTTGKWGKWEIPTIWSQYGLNGQDGDGVQYIYYLDSTGTPPENPTPLEYETNDEYQEKDKEWKPSEGSYININKETIEINSDKKWTDNPESISSEKPFQWMCCRKYRKNDEGKMSWSSFSNPTLWARYGEDGISATIIRTYYTLTNGTSEIPTTLPNINEDGTIDSGHWSSFFPDSDNGYEYGKNVVWGTNIEIDAKTNTVIEGSKFVKPFIVTGTKGDTGERGPEGPKGPVGAKGTTGIPGVNYRQLYCLGTSGENENGYFGSDDWKEEKLPEEITGWYTYVVNPNVIDIANNDELIEYSKKEENIGRVLRLITINNNKQKLYSYYLVIKKEEYKPIKEELEEELNIYLWCIQGTEKTQYNEKEDTYESTGVKWFIPFKLQGTQGLNGKQGSRGQVIYPMGIYNKEEVYVATEDKAPYIYDPNDGMYYVYNVVDEPWVGKLPENYKDIIGTDGTTPKYQYNGEWIEKDHNNELPSQNYDSNTGDNIRPYWVKFESFEAIFTKIGIIANGMVGSAVFNNEFMFSQQGIDKEGNKTNYAIESGDNPSGKSGFLSGYEFDEVEKKWKYVGTDDYIKDIDVNPYEEKDGTPIHSFRPNVCINFATGQMWLAGGKAVFGQTETNVATTNDMIDAIDGLLKTKVNGGLNLIGRIELDANNDEYFEFIESSNEKLYDEKIFRLKRLVEESELEGVVIEKVLPVEVDKEYVISVYVKNQSTVDDEEIFGGIGVYTYNTSTSEWKLLGNSSILNNKTDLWQQISYIFKPEDKTLEYYPVLYSYNTTSDDAYLYYSCLKLQEGNIATVGFEAITEDKAKNQEEINEAKKDTEDIAKGIMALNSNLTLALEDGYLSIEEQNLLKESLSNIDKEMVSLNKEHKDVSESKFLTQEQEDALNIAKEKIDTAYNAYKKQLEMLTNIKFK